MSDEGKELVVSDARRELMKESASSIKIEIPQIKIAPGGIGQFVKGDETLKKLECIIFKFHRANAIWVPDQIDKKTAFFRKLPGFTAEVDDIPICSSKDGHIGSHDFVDTDQEGIKAFGNCNLCIFNQFKSDLMGGKGKACKNGFKLFILLKDSTMPNTLQIPPTSIKAFNSYVNWCIDHNQSVSSVCTTIELEQKSSGGNNYSVCKFNKPDDVGSITLDDESIDKVMDWRLKYDSAIQNDIEKREAPAHTDSDLQNVPVDEDEELPF